jgi:hypothetical protein
MRAVLGLAVLWAAVASANALAPEVAITDADALHKYVAAGLFGAQKASMPVGRVFSDYQPQEFKPACLQAATTCESYEGTIGW